MSSHWLSISNEVSLTSERVLSPLRSRLRFDPQPGYPFWLLNSPLVLSYLLGNHSSGKPSAINALLGRGAGTARGALQRSSRAPTDAKFTVITAGDADATHVGHL